MAEPAYLDDDDEGEGSSFCCGLPVRKPHSYTNVNARPLISLHIPFLLIYFNNKRKHLLSCIRVMYQKPLASFVCDSKVSERTNISV